MLMQQLLEERRTLEPTVVDGDQKCPSIWLKIKYNNKQGKLIPNLTAKIVYGHWIKSYGQIEFKNLKF